MPLARRLKGLSFGMFQRSSPQEELAGQSAGQSRVAAGANWQAGLRCPHLSPLSGVGKSLLGESGNFLVVSASGLRNTNFYSDKNY